MRLCMDLKMIDERKIKSQLESLKYKVMKQIEDEYGKNNRRTRNIVKKLRNHASQAMTKVIAMTEYLTQWRTWILRSWAYSIEKGLSWRVWGRDNRRPIINRQWETNPQITTKVCNWGKPASWWTSTGSGTSKCQTKNVNSKIKGRENWGGWGDWGRWRVWVRDGEDWGNE